MKKPLIAITMGDPAGIGPEIILKTMDDPQVKKACRLLIFGDRHILESTARSLGKSFSISSVQRFEQAASWEESVGLYEASRLPADQVIPGRPDSRWGASVLEYIRLAARSALKGQVAAMVTCPISKEIIRSLRPSFTGHTEFLAHQAKTRSFGMMLTGQRLKVSLVTIHLSLKKALRVLDTEKILRTIELTHQTLTNRFGLREPRIAVAGLNPHAGEKGAFGSEEEKIIAPAIRKAQSQGIGVSGPHPPDTLFYWAAQGRYDAVVALYHDQGLIPLKLLHFDNAVNITMGLPFIRTSVDHGTAFDIAGKGLAKPDSLIQAVLLAVAFIGKKQDG
ncbi:MAG: 4-hydroxythreonine-4-phosphate dehydrogenase PdxA [Deltaproteobacteria bacterium]|nr:4-hydroxythreonine-4-phosphate dehydrogenase PdxA [Deltaproteobacteria bacterium]